MAATANPSAQPSAIWDEDANMAALAHLERLQEQLTNLRTTIPRVVQPFSSPPSPALFHSFKTGLVASQAEIKAFRSVFQGEETRNIFEHARERIRVDGNMKGAGEVARYGWVERWQRRSEGGKKGEKEEVVDVGAVIGDEEVERVVGVWKGRNEGLKMEEADGGRELTITFPASGQILKFHILISRDANEPRKLRAKCVGPLDLHSTISRCLASRPNANDLAFLLDMIAAYKTVKSTACAKCGNMFDKQSSRPLARRLKKGHGAGGKAEGVWEALHEGCME